MRYTVLLLAVVPLLSSGCAVSKMETFADPEFADTDYDRILIFRISETLEARKATEQKFVERLSTLGVQAIPSLGVIMPTREYTDDEIFELLQQQNMDGMLVVELTDYYVDTYQTPTQYHTNTTGTAQSNTFGTVRGGRINAQQRGQFNAQSHTYTTGGQTYTKPRARHEVKLYDTKTRRVAWMGTSFTAGNAYASGENMVAALAKEASEKLVEDGVIIAKVQE